MLQKYNILNSTVANKIVMAITGFILVGFITGHAAGNLQLYLGRDAYNTYAYFLEHTMEHALWLIRPVLVLSIILHVFTSIKLKFLNNSAKPESYKVSKYIKSTFYSRTMIWTGIMIAAFVAFHLLHYKAGIIFPEAGEKYENFGVQGLELRKDVFYMVTTGFSNIWVSLSYLVAVTMLGFHLTHSLQSMFQSLGLTFGKYSDKSGAYSKVIATIITLMFWAPPMGVLLDIIK
jgi:succinate dehydrogenase / fumarate reductase cytochrome b subunit